MIGITKAREAAPGTIRGDFAMSQQYNLIHASEDRDAAEREIKIIFDDTDIFDWEKIDDVHIYLEEEKATK
jgi:nucleoside-diphosphate kinase